MSELSDHLAVIEDEKQRLYVERRTAISGAPRTFEHIDRAKRAVWRGYRYVVVMADGMPFESDVYAQRPAAERKVGILSNIYGNNVYLYDDRTGEVLDYKGVVVQQLTERCP